MAFGQEIGRVLSDGRIIGRAEPYAKVFPSSRSVKRAVGVVAWAVLEDIALDGRIDDRGRLVAATNVRRIAANLGMSKNAVARHLGRLREHGFVLHEEQRDAGSGRYGSSWYVLDPSACLERFTTTPRPSDGDTAVDGPVERPCPTSGDTAVTGAAVSHATGHRDVGHNNKTSLEKTNHQTARETAVDDVAVDLVERLVVVGVDGAVAARLVVEHGAAVVESALAALPWHRVRNPAGWLVRAVQDGWAVPAATPRPAPAPRPSGEGGSVEPDGLDHMRWAAFAVTVLDDRDLAGVVARVTLPVDGLGRRSLPLTITQLGAWAARTFATAHGTGSLHEALTERIADARPVPADSPVTCVELPQVEVPADWKDRLQIAMSAEVAA